MSCSTLEQNCGIGREGVDKRGRSTFRTLSTLVCALRQIQANIVKFTIENGLFFYLSLWYVHVHKEQTIYVYERSTCMERSLNCLGLTGTYRTTHVPRVLMLAPGKDSLNFKILGSFPREDVIIKCTLNCLFHDLVIVI